MSETTVGEKTSSVSTSVKETIVRYVVSEKSSETAFGDLRSLAVDAQIEGIETKEDFYKFLRDGEDEFMSEYYGDDPAAVKKDGSWKYRTYLPGKYSSAKSVLGKAFDNRVAFGGIGKTEIEKLCRSAVPTLSALDTAKSKIESANTWAVKNLDGAEWEAYSAWAHEFYGKPVFGL